MTAGHGWIRGRGRGLGAEVVDADADLRQLLGIDPAAALGPAERSQLSEALVTQDAIARACTGAGEIVTDERVLDVDGVPRRCLVVIAPDRSSPVAWSLCVLDNPVADPLVDPAVGPEPAARARRLVQALDAADFGVFIQDLDGTLMYLNEAGERMYGMAADEAVGRHITEVVGDADQTMFEELTRRLDRIGSWTGRVENVDREGRHFPVSLHVALVRDDEGRPVSRISIANDISELAQMEKRAARWEKLDSLGQITGGITHDFNNLLTVMLGGAEVLAAELRGDPRLGPLAETILKAAVRGADLTSRLLVFASRQSLQPEVVSPDAVVDDVLPLLRRALDANIDVTASRGADPWHVLVDRGQLEVALMNIAVNARDAMRTGGRMEIETANVVVERADDRHAAGGEFVRIAVVDQGTGMSAAVLDRALEPFFTTKPLGSGSGLGLSMVHGFVEQSGGFVELRSELGVGTTVELYLPRADSDRGPLSVAPAASAPQRGTGSVLVVDDDDLVRAYVRAAIRDLGYDVIEASDGPQALGLLRDSAHIDLLFTDISMPGGVSGVELAAAARAMRPGIVVVLTSGRIDADIGIDATDLLLRKPYRLEQLADLLRSALGST